MSPPPACAEICGSSRLAGSYWSGDFNCSRKKRFRSEIFATRALPRNATALRTAERNSTPSKAATKFLERSRKRKSPPLTLTRRISGTNVPVAAVFLDELSLRGCLDFGGFRGGIPVSGSREFSFSDRFTGSSGAIEAFSWLCSGKPGNLHLPSAFCGQITFGSARDTCVITKRREKSDSNLIRSPKVFASRKLGDPAAETSGMVIPLNFRPPHGVTLTR